MKPLRPQTPEGIAREGAAKRTQTDIPVKAGMTRQTKGTPHPYKHGTTDALDDEKQSPFPHYAVSAPVHPGMTDAQRAKHAASPSGNEVLGSASRLGRPPEEA